MTVLTYKLCICGDMHIGSGTGIPGLIDERVLRDREGFAYIPGSTIKGLLRQSCTDLLRYRGQQNRLICKGQQHWLVEDEQQPAPGEYCQPGKLPCLICLFFGSALSEGALWFSPAEYPKEYRDLVHDLPFPAAERDMATSAHAAIDRHTGRAKEHQLFNLEVVQPVDHFTGTIRMTRLLRASEMTQGGIDLKADEILGWLTASLLFIRSVGGRRRRGWGQCKFILFEDQNQGALQAARKILGGGTK